MSILIYTHQTIKYGRLLRFLSLFTNKTLLIVVQAKDFLCQGLSYCAEETTMDGNKMAKFLLLLIAVDLLLFSSTEGKPWWRRRRSRRRRTQSYCPSSTPSGVAWKNNWHGSLYFKCPASQSVRLWQSVHRNCKQDRIHYFECGYGPIRYSERNCRWTNHYVNDYDGPVTFQCEYNGFITGVQSRYGGGARDRRFHFRCCHKPRYVAYNCKHTTYVNGWDAELKYRVPSGYFLTGAYSYHENRYEDRRWNFKICQFKKGRY
ncbi:hemagglutinin/amebocyte aggregation factor-like [Porites lutea]|uniref:hemagglutinin/amebocyte aggregation factor-like n=1 Tax=Porites lutea TaxID=51062 RepID=UPI003CC5C13A